MRSANTPSLKHINSNQTKDSSFATLDDGMVVNRLIIVTDDPELNRGILAKYRSEELKYRKVAELYGNGRNLQTYSVDSQF